MDAEKLLVHGLDEEAFGDALSLQQRRGRGGVDGEAEAGMAAQGLQGLDI